MKPPVLDPLQATVREYIGDTLIEKLETLTTHDKWGVYKNFIQASGNVRLKFLSGRERFWCVTIKSDIENAQ